MRIALQKIILKFLKIFNITIIKNDTLISLKEYEKDISKISKIPIEEIIKILKIIKISKSELHQEAYVLLKSKFKKNGFFVEFGAKNGIDSSNTLILEKKFYWKGILAEPAKAYRFSIKKNRSCKNICTNCVFSISNLKIKFFESQDLGYSTIYKFKNKDKHTRVKKNIYEVKTISLIDLLKKYKAPKVIDYLSIDTEGSEFEILKNFNFKAYQFKIITIEHNFTSQREKIYNLLTKNGYKREYTGLSKWDDWYIKI
jgi:FkbM family methyltransferase